MMAITTGLAFLYMRSQGWSLAMPFRSSCFSA